MDRSSSELFGGGSALGVCVADCTLGGGGCANFKQAECVPVFPDEPDRGLCFEACTVGASDGGKCRARDNLACDLVPGQSGNRGFCRPLCQLDADCGGRKCDRRYGVCVDEVAQAQNFGKRCDPEAAVSSCDGVCVTLESTYSVCSHRCKFGQMLDCQSASSPTGACTFSSTAGTIDDTGFCGQLCNCNAECDHTEAVCDPFGNADLEHAFGKKGVCAPPALASSAIEACL